MDTYFLRCENGHYYDAEKYSECPYCAMEKPLQAQRVSDGSDTESLTVKSPGEIRLERPAFSGASSDPSEDVTVRYSEVKPKPQGRERDRENATVRLPEAGSGNVGLDPVDVVISDPVSMMPGMKGYQGGMPERQGGPSQGPERQGPQGFQQYREGVPERQSCPESSPERWGRPENVSERQGYPDREPERRGYPNREPERRGYPDREPERRGYPDAAPERAVPKREARRLLQPVGWLVCVGGPDFGMSYPLKEGRNSVGRSDEMDVTLKNDTAVSRRSHVWVEYSEPQRKFTVSVGEVRYPVYVNDELLVLPLEMQRNDILELGNSCLMLIPCCDEKFSWRSAGRERQGEG